MNMHIYICICICIAMSTNTYNNMLYLGLFGCSKMSAPVGVFFPCPQNTAGVNGENDENGEDANEENESARD